MSDVAASLAPVFVLGGYQSDFARKASRDDLSIAHLVAEAALGAVAAAAIEPLDVAVGHVGNFAGESYVGQGHLGGLLVEADPAAWSGLPTSRHEAACASGSVAVLAAMADLESGRYPTALVVGVELMRNMGGFESQQVLGSAAWVPREIDGIDWPWPHLFSQLGEEYAARYGLDEAHLSAIAEKNFSNARHNPLAQTRDWEFGAGAFDRDDETNPAITGIIRRQDCSQVTDGSAAVVLAGRAFAERWAAERHLTLEQVPRIAGWGHRTSRMALADKLRDSQGQPYVCPAVRGAITDAYARAGIGGPDDLDVVETHDCFTTTEYLAIDHLGLTDPGESWKAIEGGDTAMGGRLPINPSGGLIGGGHPVGATGARMLVDAWKQTTGQAGDTQVDGARRAATLNLGGSATTSVCFVVERAA